MMMRRQGVEHDDYQGFMNQRRGRRLLPDIRTAILARMRGYIGGFYPSPLKGEASELGYYPLSDATRDELKKIEEETSLLTGG